MKNKIIYLLKSKIKLKIVGKNINRFIVRLNNNNIEILKCFYINKEEVDVVIYYKDYNKVKEIKTIYNVEQIGNYGLLRIKKKLCIYKYLVLSIIFGFFLLYFLTNIIFSVEIIYNDVDIRNFLKNELIQYGIKEKSFKKNYNEIETIKKELLNKYKNKLEWLEIEVIGTKYVVRVELRKINDKKEIIENRHVVAKKDAIIKEIKASSGQIIREINNYVKKGDVVISGDILIDDVKKDTVVAEGTVFGETWYEISVTYPFAYAETKYTNNKKTVYVLKIFNKNIELFNARPFKNKKVEDKIIMQNKLLPIQLLKQKQFELEIIDEILTIDEALNKALEKANEKIKSNLKDGEYIINYKILNTNIRESELELKMFFSVYENITDYQIITKEDLES